MPPRYAYWTILVDDQATAFRSGSQEDLMPTFKRLKEKHPSATMMWFQNGKLWPSRTDAQEAMIGRGEAGRRNVRGHHRPGVIHREHDRRLLGRHRHAHLRTSQRGNQGRGLILVRLCRGRRKVYAPLGAVLRRDRHADNRDASGS